MPTPVPRFGLGHFVGLAVLALGAPATAAPERTVNLGAAPVGTVDTVEFEARNTSCDPPQNFRFVPRDMPWLKFGSGNRLTNVERGKVKRLVAHVDLSGMKPGRYSGRLDVDCETCGNFVMSECHIDQGSMMLEIEVTASRQRRSTPAPRVNTFGG